MMYFLQKHMHNLNSFNTIKRVMVKEEEAV